MRQRGYEATPDSGIKVYNDAYHKLLPDLVCSKCGKQFKYRGLKDIDAVEGLIWNPQTQQYEKSGGAEVLCDECERNK